MHAHSFCRYLRHSRPWETAFVVFYVCPDTPFLTQIPSFGWFLGGVWMQVLSLFTVVGVSLASRWPCLEIAFCRYLRYSSIPSAMLGKAWKSHFVAIYGTRAHFCHAWEGLEITLCRYLRYSRSRLPCLGRLGNHILLLFTVLALTLAMLGKA